MRQNSAGRLQWLSKALRGSLYATTFALVGASGAAWAQVSADGSIGYVLTARYWATYETEGGERECPNGFNDGPREEFAKLFPEDGTVRTVVETRLKREGQQWHPKTLGEPLPLHEAQGSISYGLNLDGKIQSDDFESPEGELGIDNQLYRVIGCTAGYREEGNGATRHFENEYMQRYNVNRWVLEITGVDSLIDDDEVTVTTYRGMNSLLTDATGNEFLPGGTQRVDTRWGQQYIAHLKGKIVNGVLTTEPIDELKVPWALTFATNGYQIFRAPRLQLKLTSDSAEGLLAGYVDIDNFNRLTNENWSTHHASYGQNASASQYHAMRRLADGYPNPESGENTAISSAVDVHFAQVFVRHPGEEEIRMVQSTAR